MTERRKEKQEKHSKEKEQRRALECGSGCGGGGEKMGGRLRSGRAMLPPLEEEWI